MFFTITISLGVHVYPRVSRGLKALQSAALEFSALMGVGLALWSISGIVRHALDSWCLYGRALF